MDLAKAVQGHVVAGIDGSSSSEGAAMWAAGWAQATGRPLLLVMASGDEPGTIFGRHRADEHRGEADTVLRRASTVLREAFPSLEIRAVPPVANSAVQTLTTTSAHAALLAIGTRGLSGIAGILLGGVADDVVASAAGPVVVVPDSGDGRSRPDGSHDVDGDHGDAASAARTGAPVVLGVPGPQESTEPVRFALAAAEALDAPLVALSTWINDPVDGVVPGELAQSRQEEYVRTLLEPLVRTATVPVHLRVEPGEAGPALVEASRTARLVVVGTHRRRGLRGLWHGSTSRHLASHALAPVAVVPSG